jgi:hypothetical protein
MNTTSSFTTPLLQTSEWSVKQNAPNQPPVGQMQPPVGQRHCSHHDVHVVHDEPCAICMDTIDDCDELACGHKFCSGCINKWLCENTRCPLCRKNPVMEQLKKNAVGHVLFNAYAFEHVLPRAVQVETGTGRSQAQERVEQRCAEICIQIEKMKTVFMEHFESIDGEMMNTLYSQQAVTVTRFQQMAEMMKQQSLVAHSKASANVVYDDWRSVPSEDQQAFLESAGPVAKELKGIITAETDDNGKEYAIIHPEFDVPASICTGGDPRERGITGHRCNMETCPCQTFVSKIVLFEGQSVQLNGIVAYAGQQYGDQNIGFNGSSIILMHGALFRSDIISWDSTVPSRRLFPPGAIDSPQVRRPTSNRPSVPNEEEYDSEDDIPLSELARREIERARARGEDTNWSIDGGGVTDFDHALPAEVPLAPDACPWNVGDSVIKMAGIDLGMTGIIIRMSSNGKKIKVKWGEGGGMRWNMQSWQNFELVQV